MMPIGSDAVVPGVAVVTARVISCSAVMFSVAAPCSARLATMSRSLPQPRSWSAA
jgi:hypothetical protein